MLETKKELQINKNRKKISFKIMRFLSFLLFRKPKLLFTDGEFPNEPILLLSNHVGKKAPGKIELYYPRPFMMWGTHEMTEGFKAVHKYLRFTYYHKKKHLPKFLAFIVASIVSPFVNYYYRGLRLLPTYTDRRLLTTVKLTEEEYESGKDIIIYPEDSSKGYKDEIEKFFSGFASFLGIMYRKGHDIPVMVTYFDRRRNTFIFSGISKYSTLLEKYKTNDEIAEAMRKKMNSLRDVK